MLINKITALVICLWSSLVSLAQQPGSTDVYVDKNGVMRWAKNKAEVQGFGENYTVPFAHAYRTAKKLGIAPKKAIDDDIYHFARLGFDSYRVHVWDTEISDSLGNLLPNEHLDLLDYSLKQMKDRGIRYLLTPIAYWGNGWPEPDEKTPGFSAKYGKAACLTNPDAIKAQETYLYQFLNHVNPYTGLAYKNDPDLIAFEISNEPHHGGEPASVTDFINRMVTSIRKTGCQKPIFYNISHSIHLADAYFKAAIQGGTFQWYPTGLGSRHELRGNFLPNVDKYAIPFANNEKLKKMAKIVYEFDAADIGRSYIYPAMARSFRESGMQLAHHFAYDPTFMAYANTEYDTHFMNLVYAPQKALSLKLASEVFHRVPMYKSFGGYPTDTLFDAFRVSYGQDLAEMRTDTKFIYTNTTSSQPIAPAKLEEIAGFGNSPMVTYGGQGAYFLDRIEPGVWRLEVLPDAIWVDNLFGRNSLKKENAVINWRSWPIGIHLPDLGEGFSISGLNKGNQMTGMANGQGFTVSPGSYLLVRKGITTRLTGESLWKNIRLGEFIAPATTLKKNYLLHTPVREATSGRQLILTATVATPTDPLAVEAWVTAPGARNEVIKFEKGPGYTYTALLPDRLLREGFLRYYIVVKESEKTWTYPAAREDSPANWDFFSDTPYQVRVVPKSAPVELFNAQTDAAQLSRQYIRGSDVVPAQQPGQAELLINIEKLALSDPENPTGDKLYDYSMRYNFRPNIAGRKADLPNLTNLVFHGRALNNTACTLQLALMTKDGLVFGNTVTVDPKEGGYTLPISQLRAVKFVSLPRPYPTFLPYYIETGPASALDISQVETLQLSIGPGLTAGKRENKHGVAIRSITIE